MAKKNKPKTFDHTVTPQDLANNPELVSEGVKEGDVIGIPENEHADDEMVKEFEKTSGIIEGDNALVISTGTVSVISGEDQAVDKSLVKILVKYPEDYGSKKYLPEGEREVSAESAQQFIEKGIATRVD